jgi:hypothetical protein
MSPKRRTARTTSTSKAVTVTRRNGAITIDPWTVVLLKGQSVEWKFEGCNGRITKKGFRGLPFDGRLPGTGKKKILSPPTNRKGKFNYNIILDPGSRTKKVKIDPEMIIKPK